MSRPSPSHTCRVRDTYDNRRALPGGRLDGQGAADQAGALAHADEPELPVQASIEPVWTEASAVVLDGDRGLLAVVREQHGDTRRLSMLADVVQRLLDDPIHVHGGIGRQRMIVAAL